MPNLTLHGKITWARKIFAKINNGTVLSQIAKKLNVTDILPLLLGVSAFPFHSWLMNLFSNAVLSIDQTCFNYRLSRARIVTERACGRLKGRWRELQRKCECYYSTKRQQHT